MAHVPVPGSQLTGAPTAFEDAIPAAVLDLLATLWAAGHAAYVVGGSLRDVLLGRRPADWDMASNAEPERVVELFPGAVYENRFGTVAVRRDGEVFEITTFRTDHDYADFRRPHRVEFGDTIELDLARRDFTVNAMAWGARPGETPAPRRPVRRPIGRGARGCSGRSAIRRPGSRRTRSGWSARSASRRRSASRSRPRRWPAVEDKATLVAHLSGERIAAELDKLLAAPTPSAGLRLLSRDGRARRDLAGAGGAARACPRTRSPARTCGTTRSGRSMRRRRRGRSSAWRRSSTTSASPRPSPTAGSWATTRSAPSWPAPSSTGCDAPRAVRDRVVELVRQHMFSYESNWSDAAVRRFIGKMAAIGDGRARRAARPARGRQRRVGAAGRRGPAGRAPGPGRRRARAPTSSSIGAAWRSTGPI